ncbi:MULTISPECIES: type II secretion system protein GspL [unclassified Pseudomonas]|uniref:GspL/Epsl periplasmic domain-containing protein n=1 Tax=unclassified Pseudomonas TaxID=196821 RepID=UPI002446EB64|nr:MULTISPECIES: type II secretion system protein GspL [unclassified Pseudomonas]MDH0304959.1 type II secretion system protein GspL [Pseudomonas sp. GD04091]MDH1987558.1 type II secretion system protein GspL [Pseudomonas sp. GD03689]
MKLEWRRRSTTQPWLLLRPGQAWDWLLVEQGRPVRAGQGQPPAGLGARIALIVPAEHCSHFQVPAPPGLKREEWSLLLEDRLAQAADEVSCACVGRLPGQLRLVVVARRWLDEWRAQCDAWALPVERCWAEFQLLPERCHVWQRGEMTLCTGVDGEGRAHWLAWPRTPGLDAPVDWQDGAPGTVEGAWPPTLASLDRVPALFESRRARPRLRLAVAQWRLAVACLVLAVAWGGLWCAQQWRQAKVYREQVLAVTAAQASPRQAAQALKRLRDEQNEREVRLRRLEGLQAQLQAWLSGNPGWQLRAVRFDGQRWHLELEGEGDTPPWQAMATAMGAPAQVEEDGRRVVFDLGVAS